MYGDFDDDYTERRHFYRTRHFRKLRKPEKCEKSSCETLWYRPLTILRGNIADMYDKLCCDHHSICRFCEKGEAMVLSKACRKCLNNRHLYITIYILKTKGHIPKDVIKIIVDKVKLWEQKEKYGSILSF